MLRELEHLQQANRHLADAERRIAEQRDRIDELVRGRHDTTHSLTLLRLFEETLDLMVAHRNMILRELGVDKSTGKLPLLRSSPKKTMQEVLNSRAQVCSRRAALTTDPLIPPTC